MVAETLDVEKGEAWFSPLDMTYAYGQVPLHLLTGKQWFPIYSMMLGSFPRLPPVKLFYLCLFAACPIWSM